MFERITQTAAQVATDLSRRRFVSQLGRRALALTGLLGILLGLPASAEAGRKRHCCYQCYDGRGDFYFRRCVDSSGACATAFGNCWLLGEVTNCKQCFGS